MIVNLIEEYKLLEKEQQKLAKKKEALAEQIAREKQEDQQLEEVFQKSGFPTPRALVKALMVKYGIKVTGSVANGKPRKRTRITRELCEAIKREVASGRSKNSVSKSFEVSYAVVSKIVRGDYDAR